MSQHPDPQPAPAHRKHGAVPVVTVLGGTGQMGAAVADRLGRRGAQVRRAARSTGVDVRTGVGLEQALAGADVAVDCLNVLTQSRRAVPFFSGAAARVSAAAESAGVGHLVVLSIVNVADPLPRRLTGYYAGKAAQEARYAEAGVPVTLVRTTAWFTLAQLFLDMGLVAGLHVVPSLRLQPVHPDAVADLLVDVALGAAPPEGRLLQLAGPQVLSSARMAASLARAEGVPGRVVGIPVPGAAGRCLLPRSDQDVITDPRTYSDWLAQRQPGG